MDKPPHDIPVAIPDKPVRLLDQFRAWLRRNNYRYQTEKTYVHWAIAYIRFHHLRHPREMGAAEIEAFLDYLAVKRGCSVSTQKVALNALNCFYRKFLGTPFEAISFRHASKPVRVPVVFSDQEARSIIAMLEDPWRLMAEIMYGTGLRISETLRLRIKDIDFDQGMIIVREGKGRKDRITILLDGYLSGYRSA